MKPMHLWISALALLAVAASEGAATAQSPRLPLRALEFAPPAIDMALCLDTAWMWSFLDETSSHPPTKQARRRLEDELKKISKAVGGGAGLLKSKDLSYMCSFKINQTDRHVLVLEFNKILPVWLQRTIGKHADVAALVERDKRHLLIYSKIPGYAKSASQQTATLMKHTGLSADMQRMILALAPHKFWSVKEVDKTTYHRIHELCEISKSPGPEFAQLRYFTTSISTLQPNAVSVELGFHYASAQEAMKYAQPLKQRLPFPRRKRTAPAVRGTAVHVTVRDLSFAELTKLVTRL